LSLFERLWARLALKFPKSVQKAKKTSVDVLKDAEIFAELQKGSPKLSSKQKVKKHGVFPLLFTDHKSFFFFLFLGDLVVTCINGPALSLTLFFSLIGTSKLYAHFRFCIPQHFFKWSKYVFPLFPPMMTKIFFL
jgi:hypothetical protein